MRDKSYSAVHQRYTHQLCVLSLIFAKLLILKNCTFRSITVASSLCVSNLLL